MYSTRVQLSVIEFAVDYLVSYGDSSSASEFRFLRVQFPGRVCHSARITRRYPEMSGFGYDVGRGSCMQVRCDA